MQVADLRGDAVLLAPIPKRGLNISVGSAKVHDGRSADSVEALRRQQSACQAGCALGVPKARLDRCDGDRGSDTCQRTIPARRERLAQRSHLDGVSQWSACNQGAISDLGCKFNLGWHTIFRATKCGRLLFRMQQIAVRFGYSMYKEFERACAMHGNEADASRLDFTSGERICHELPLGGPVGGGQAAGAAVLVHSAALQHRNRQQRRVRVALWRHYKHHKALSAAVAVRRCIERAAAAGWGERLLQSRQMPIE